MKKNLVLVGMMGVGKSTLGKILAEKLKINFIDIDKLIEKKHKMKIKEIFKQKGEAFFRKEEEIIALENLKKANSVIALGGGAFLNKNVQNLIIDSCISVWLDLSINILNHRLKKNYKRPLLQKDENMKILEKLYNSRKNSYQLANHRINCDKLNINNIIKKLLDIYEK